MPRKISLIPIMRPIVPPDRVILHGIVLDLSGGRVEEFKSLVSRGDVFDAVFLGGKVSSAPV